MLRHFRAIPVMGALLLFTPRTWIRQRNLRKPIGSILPRSPASASFASGICTARATSSPFQDAIRIQPGLQAGSMRRAMKLASLSLTGVAQALSAQASL